MTRAVSFFVEGVPVPKARPRVTRSGHTYTPARTAAWEETIGWAAKAAMVGAPPFAGVLEVTLRFSGARASADLDNLTKSVLDGLNKIVFLDDKQVAGLDLGRSTWTKKGVFIRVFERKVA